MGYWSIRFVWVHLLGIAGLLALYPTVGPCAVAQFTVARDAAQAAKTPPQRAQPRAGRLINAFALNEYLASPVAPQQEFVEYLYFGPDTTFADWAIADARTLAYVSSTEGYVRSGDMLLMLPEGSTMDVPEASDTLHIFYIPAWPSLNNGGDALYLIVGADTVSAYTYASSARGRSAERVSPQSTYWRTSTDPLGHSAGRQNAVFSRDTAPPTILLAELSHLGRVYVHADEPVDLSAAQAVLRSAHGAWMAPLVPNYAWSRDSVAVFRADVPAGVMEQNDIEITIAGWSDLVGNRADVSYPVVMPASGALFSELLFRQRADPYDFIPDQADLIALTGWHAGSAQSYQGVTTLVDCAVRSPANEHGHVDTLGVVPPGFPLGDPSAQVVLSQGSLGLHRAMGVPPPAFAHVGPPRSDPWWIAPESLRSLPSTGVLELWCGPERMDRLAYGDHLHAADLSDGLGWALGRRRVAGTARNQWTTLREIPGGAVHHLGGDPRAAKPTAQPGVDDVFISEVLVSTTDTSYPEFIEFLSTAPIDASGLGLVRARAPEDTLWVDGSMRARWDGFHVVMADGDPSNVSPQTVSPFEAASLQRVASRTLSLSDEGDTLWLVNTTGMRLDVLAYAPDQHHPAWRETRGRSLERMVIGDRPQVTDGWTTSVHARGASPGQVNSVSISRTDDASSPSAIVPLSLEGRIIDRRRYAQTTTGDGANTGAGVGTGTDASAETWARSTPGVRSAAGEVLLRWHFSAGPVMLTLRVYSEAGALLGDLMDHDMIPARGSRVLDARLSSGTLLSPGRYILLGTWSHLDGDHIRTGRQKLVVGVR